MAMAATSLETSSDPNSQFYARGARSITILDLYSTCLVDYGHCSSGKMSCREKALGIKKKQEKRKKKKEKRNTKSSKFHVTSLENMYTNKTINVL